MLVALKRLEKRLVGTESEKEEENSSAFAQFVVSLCQNKEAPIDATDAVRNWLMPTLAKTDAKQMHTVMVEMEVLSRLVTDAQVNIRWAFESKDASVWEGEESSAEEVDECRGSCVELPRLIVMLCVVGTDPSVRKCPKFFAQSSRALRATTKALAKMSGGFSSSTLEWLNVKLADVCWEVKFILSNWMSEANAEHGFVPRIPGSLRDRLSESAQTKFGEIECSAGHREEEEEEELQCLFELASYDEKLTREVVADLKSRRFSGKALVATMAANLPNKDVDIWKILLRLIEDLNLNGEVGGSELPTETLSGAAMDATQKIRSHLLIGDAVLLALQQNVWNSRVSGDLIEKFSNLVRPFLEQTFQDGLISDGAVQDLRSKLRMRTFLNTITFLCDEVSARYKKAVGETHPLFDFASNLPSSFEMLLDFLEEKSVQIGYPYKAKGEHEPIKEAVEREDCETQTETHEDASQKEMEKRNKHNGHSSEVDAGRTEAQWGCEEEVAQGEEASEMNRKSLNGKTEVKKEETQKEESDIDLKEGAFVDGNDSTGTAPSGVVRMGGLKREIRSFLSANAPSFVSTTRGMGLSGSEQKCSRGMAIRGPLPVLSREQLFGSKERDASGGSVKHGWEYNEADFPKLATSGEAEKESGRPDLQKYSAEESEVRSSGGGFSRSGRNRELEDHEWRRGERSGENRAREEDGERDRRYAEHRGDDQMNGGQRRGGFQNRDGPRGGFSQGGFGRRHQGRGGFESGNVLRTFCGFHFQNGPRSARDFVFVLKEHIIINPLLLLLFLTPTDDAIFYLEVEQEPIETKECFTSGGFDGRRLANWSDQRRRRGGERRDDEDRSGRVFRGKSEFGKGRRGGATSYDRKHAGDPDIK